jgi:hypothetical protein
VVVIQRRSAVASLLVLKVLSDLSEPEAGEEPRRVLRLADDKGSSIAKVG